jgi:serine/threonine-protein kinase
MVWPTGQQLQGGKYIIEKVLGHGGFGVTYKALALLEGSIKCPNCESTQLRKHGRPNGKQQYQCCNCGRYFVNSKALPLQPDQYVVLKTPHEYLKNKPDYDKLKERFIKEGKTLSRLSTKPHPHIVRFTDLFQEDESYCLVMDFVPGENLLELVDRKKALPEAEATRYIRQIGEALIFVHQAGLVHRDAHPGNIILRSDDRAILIDFGIAKEQVPSALSSTGNIGHRGFAPYEQTENGSREPTVDVYSLSATLYYAVTGHCPPISFDRKVYNATLTPPKQIIPDLSNGLNQAILQGMALEPENRPQSMQEWLNLLEVPKVIIPPPAAPAYKPPRPVAPAYKREVIQPSSDTSSPPQPKEPDIQQPQPKEPDIQQTRTIPWVWLVAGLLSYGFTGFILAAYSAPFWLLAAAVAAGVALVGAEAESWAWVRDGLGPERWAWVGALALSGVGIWVAALTWVGAWVVFGALVWALILPLTVAGAGCKLRLKFFSKLHTCLILVGTSSLGLWLGWLVSLTVQRLLSR